MTRRLLLGYLGLVIVVLAALEVPLGVENAHTARRDLAKRSRRRHDTRVPCAGGSARAHAKQTRARRGYCVPLRARYRRPSRDREPPRRCPDRHQSTRQGAETFASRPEIAAALRGRVAAGTRQSETLHATLLYVAVPIAAAGHVDGAVRITYPTSAVDARIRRYWLVLLAIAGIVLSVATVVGLRLAAFVVRPLRGLEHAAAAVGRGDLSKRAPQEQGPPEVRSLATVFNEMVARLELLLHSQQEFVADASHQLRSPLTALRLRLESRTRRRAAWKGGARGALAEVERLAGLVDSLLALARADAEAAPSGRVDLARLVRDRVQAWSALAEERGVHLVRRADGSPAADASEERIRQALDNLIENAVEVSPRGGR